MNDSVRFPVDLPVGPYLPDHRFEGRVVLPAVEAMQTLATAVKRFRPEADVTGLSQARFGKFLYIDSDVPHFSALIDIEVRENGDIAAALLTKSKSKKTAITRVKEHAALRFPLLKPNQSEPPPDLSSALEGICMEISSEELYRDLVPFGPSFHNIRDPLLVSRDVAIARTHAPPEAAKGGEEAVLGSPFPLDASFHAACAWGQRYAGMVAFPVGIEKRVLLRRTVPGETYLSRIFPVRMEGGLLEFDIWIYDERGNPCEGACGVTMKDVSAGRMKPPRWVIEENAGSSLERIRSLCRGVSVVELRSVLPFGHRALSDHEKERLHRMGEARRKSYLAARLACKRLYRTLRGKDRLTPASGINTICPDQVRPCCPLGGDRPPVCCSVSHDHRFCIAAASDNRIGVDVERISERVLKSRHLYMDESEQSLVRGGALGEVETAARIWTIKEGASKAYNMNLAESWNRVRVRAVGPFESRFELDGTRPGTAVHETVGSHLFTLVCEEGVAA